jgi:hypothetical protein
MELNVQLSILTSNKRIRARLFAREENKGFPPEKLHAMHRGNFVVQKRTPPAMHR